MSDVGSIRQGLFLGIASWCVIISCTNDANAQITPDRTLPSNSTVKLEGNTRTIEGGTRAGSNLFHSFQQFSIPTGSTAFFNNTTDIQNIISRVTGGSISNIDGLISANGTANLFVINPHGIIFGPNASLSIGGSFVASTANSLKFADGFEFSATNPQTIPLLTISVPIGLQYGGNPVRILNQSQATNSNGESVGLQVQPGKTLAIVGGDVSLDGGTMLAPGGRVEIGGLAGEGTLKLNVASTDIQLSYPPGVQRADISLNNGAIVDVTAGGGGSIVINARNIDISGASYLIAGIKEGLEAIGSKAGDITLNATGAISLRQLSAILNQVNSDAIGNSGDINIAAGALNMTDIASLNVSTFGQGNAGNVNIDVSGPVNITGGSNYLASGVLSIVGNGATGNGGNIKITSQSLSLDGGSYSIQGAVLSASSLGQGNAGSITVQANDAVSVANSGISTFVFGSIGNSGNINIRAKSLSLTGGSILTSTNIGQGKLGNIQINASDSISISGINPINGLATELQTGTGAASQGNGGDITVNTSSFRISDGAALDAGTESSGNGGNITVNAKTFEAVQGGQLITSTSGSGKGGNITLNVTDSVALSGSDPTFNDRLARFGRGIVGRNGNESPVSGLFANTAPSSTGEGGSLSIATGQLIVNDYAQVAVNSEGSLKAGNLEISARSIQLDNGGRLTAQTTSSNGGNITLQLRDFLLLRHNSQISGTAGTAEAGGDGGNITINAPSGFIVAVRGENSDITANAFSGRGGKVNINTQGNFFIAPLSRSELESHLMQISPGLPLDPSLLPTNDITAISQTTPTLNGIVQINTADIDPSRGLVNLPTVTEDAPKLVASDCAAFADSGGSSFTVTGRGGIPPSPDELLSPDVVWSDTRLPAVQQQHESGKPAAKPHLLPKPEAVKIVPATGWVFDGKGEVTLISSAPDITAMEFTPASCSGR